MSSEHPLFIQARERIGGRESKKIPDILAVHQGRTFSEAAVLIPLYMKNGEPTILFTKRSQSVGSHKGQISFPGGARDQSDEDLLHTALRETFEEVGIPPEKVDPLGAMDEMRTVSFFRVAPYVGILKETPQIIVNPAEIEVPIEVPLAHLLRQENCEQTRVTAAPEGWPSIFCSFRYLDYTIWGATARILMQFINEAYDFAWLEHQSPASLSQ
jgi:8-oxo-dGTP pyrophosphatase MutT (NUDIX family)